jgi:hypothetical protein
MISEEIPKTAILPYPLLTLQLHIRRNEEADRNSDHQQTTAAHATSIGFS